MIQFNYKKTERTAALSLLSKKNASVTIWAPSSEFVSSSIPSWQILTAHARPFRGTRDLAFCLNVPLDSLLVWASSGGSGETARMRRLAWTFAARIGDKYQIRLTRSILHVRVYMRSCGGPPSPGGSESDCESRGRWFELLDWNTVGTSCNPNTNK